MASSTGTDRRDSGTGQDTPLGVCPCPAPLPATPSGTWRDIVPSCPVVPYLGLAAGAEVAVADGLDAALRRLESWSLLRGSVM